MMWIQLGHQFHDDFSSNSYTSSSSTIYFWDPIQMVQPIFPHLFCFSWLLLPQPPVCCYPFVFHDKSMIFHFKTLHQASFAPPNKIYFCPLLQLTSRPYLSDYHCFIFHAYEKFNLYHYFISSLFLCFIYIYI